MILPVWKLSFKRIGEEIAKTREKYKTTYNIVLIASSVPENMKSHLVVEVLLKYKVLKWICLFHLQNAQFHPVPYWVCRFVHQQAFFSFF